MDRFWYTVGQLVTKGEYHGDICLIIGDDLVGDPILDSLFLRERVTVKYFPDLSFSDRFLEINRTLPNFDKLSSSIYFII